MAQIQNNYIKAKKFAAMVVGALARDSILPMSFTRFDGGGFRGAENDTVTFKLPGVTTARDYEWRTRTNPIVLDMIGRTSVAIKLDKHVYNAVPITDEENTLDLTSFGQEILTPQVVAVRERLEQHTVNALATLPFKTTDLNASASDDPFSWALYAKGVLDRQGTPRGGRNLLVGTNVLNWLMESERVTKMDPSAATTAFREATLGRVAGFNVVDGGQLLGPNDIYAVHPSAMIIANVAPDVPDGAKWGAKAAHQGFNMRIIRDYDTNFARDRSFVSTFAGLNSVNDEYEYEGTGLDRKIVLDTEGNPVITGKNVRGASGQFTPSSP